RKSAVSDRRNLTRAKASDTRTSAWFAKKRRRSRRESPMNEKKVARMRRARSGRKKMREIGATRLTVHRTPRHIYAQVIAPEGARILVAASTLDASLRKAGKTGNKDAAAQVGRLIAERAKAAGITRVAFDRSGFKYHGRVKALADAAREGGL